MHDPFGDSQPGNFSGKRKTLIRVLGLLLTAAMLCGCAAGIPAETEVTAVTEETESLQSALQENMDAIRSLGTGPDDSYRTFYEIFVYSFCDSDGDGIGDLPGVISRLDYLQELGITGIWLMPVHPSPSYHKYDVTDYFAVDPAYGTMEDMERLLDEAEKRGIRVILDLVLNHTSRLHPWFQTAAAYLAELQPGEEPDIAVCPEAEFYNFERADQCPSGYYEVPGASGWYYEGRFSPDMPDVNFGSELLREKQREIMDFWLQKGADGFRLDAAKEFYSGNTEKNLEVLAWIQSTARELKPDCYLVAEVWDSFMAVSEYYKSGFISLFNFPFGTSDGKISKVLRGAGNASLVSSFAEAQEKAEEAFRKNNPNYIDAPFFSNHDVGRIAGFVGRVEEKVKLAAAMNLFMSGSAFIYYGEEIGMVCGKLDDPSYRAPMYWNEKEDSAMTQPPPGCTLPETYPFGSLRQQQEDPGSIYHYYRQAIAIRNAIPAIARGIPTVEESLNVDSVSACRKTWLKDTAILLMNISEEEKTIDLSAYRMYDLAAVLPANGETVTRQEDSLVLPPFACAVLVKN